jgi:hypothetical protein
MKPSADFLRICRELDGRRRFFGKHRSRQPLQLQMDKINYWVDAEGLELLCDRWRWAERLVPATKEKIW